MSAAEPDPDARIDVTPAALPRQAVGLRYGRGDAAAPRIVAKGTGEVAERILAIARESGVPVEHDPDLVQMLSRSELGEEIPVQLYEGVARLLGWLWRINEAARSDAPRQ
jgi:flagellar biosynthesis protein